MEEYGRVFVNQSRSSLNQMVRDGLLSDGIEVNHLSNDDRLMGKASKARSRKRSGKRRGSGSFRPFHLVFVDICFVLNDSKTDRHGYRYVISFIDAAVGAAKSYAMRTKDEATDCFIQYRSWVASNAPAIEAELGLPAGSISIKLLASDRDSVMTATHGHVRTAFDEECFRSEILRWFASTNDSDHCGKLKPTLNISTSVCYIGAPGRRCPATLLS